MTLDDLYGHLLAHELRLEQNQPAVDLALTSANIAAKKGSSRGGRGGRSQQFFSFGRGHNSNNNSNRNFRGRGHGRGSTSFLELLAPSVKSASNPDMMHWPVIIDLTTLIKGIQIKTCKLILLHLSL